MTSIEASNAVLPQRKKSVQGMFIASRTVVNVLAKVKPPSNRRLVDLPSTATMEEAFDVLLAEDILSVPVYELQADNTKKYLTIISVLDLLKLLSSHVSVFFFSCKSVGKFHSIYGSLSPFLGCC